MEFLPVVAMGLLVVKGLDFLRYARARDLNGVLTQLSAWAVGILVVWLVSQSDWADGINIGDLALGKLGVWSIVFVGMSVASGASFAKDITKAIDNHQSAAIPTLTAPTPPAAE